MTTPSDAKLLWPTAHAQRRLRVARATQRPEERAQFAEDPTATFVAWTAISRTYDNDARLATSELASYTYDGAGRITAIEQNLYMPVTTSTFALGVSKFKVEYDSCNRITRMQRDMPAPPAPDPQQQQRPKDPGQSAQALRASADATAADSNPNAPTARFAESEIFSYDANGNRTAKTEVLLLIRLSPGTLTTGLTTQRDSRLPERADGRHRRQPRRRELRGRPAGGQVCLAPAAVPPAPAAHRRGLQSEPAVAHADRAARRTAAGADLRGAVRLHPRQPRQGDGRNADQGRARRAGQDG